MSQIVSFVKQLFKHQTEEEKWYSRIKGLSIYIIQKLENLLKRDKLIKLEFICESKQGVILKAYSNKLKQEVALKVSREQRKSYEDLKREFEIIKSIKEGLNIVQIYDFIFYEKYLVSVLVMEHCEMSLYEEMELLKSFNKWFSREEITSIIIQMAHALTQIHCYKIIHADIKPQNILKSKDGTYKLCDFGLSKRLNQDFSTTKEIYGLTLRYSSPEQFSYFENQESVLSCKTDIFSLGLVFLELLKYPLSDNCAKIIRENCFEKLSQLQSFQYPKVFQIFRQRFFGVDPKSRISSYEIIYSLLEELPFRESNLIDLLCLVESIKRQEMFDNSKQIQYVLNVKLYNSLIEIFIFNQLPNSLIENLSYTSNQQTLNQQNQQINKQCSDELTNQSTDIMIQQNQNQHTQEYLTNNYNLNSKNKQISSPKKYHLIGDAISNAALICEQLGKFNKAIILRKNARQTYQKVHPQGCIEIVNQLQQLCWNNYQLKQYEKAVQYGLRSVDMAKYLFKDQKHTSIAESYRKLAWAYQQINKRHQGLECAQLALNIYIEIYGEQPHKDTAHTLNTLGAIHSGVKNYKQELEYKLQSLDMFQQLYKNINHPNLAASLNNVGVAYHNLQKFDKALLYYEQSLKMKKFIFGKIHPEIANTLRNIAELQKKLNQKQDLLLTLKELNDVIYEIESQQEDPFQDNQNFTKAKDKSQFNILINEDLELFQ